MGMMMQMMMQWVILNPGLSVLRVCVEMIKKNRRENNDELVNIRDDVGDEYDKGITEDRKENYNVND